MKNNVKKYLHTVLKSGPADELNELVLKSDEAIRLEYALPNLVSYVWWLLSDSVSRNIEVLYFVSQEGYILKEIADIFVKKFSLPVTCRYIYCSSRAVSISAYHLMDDERYKHIFRGGYGISPFVILDRVLLSDRERKQIYNDICFDMDNEHTHLSKSGRIRFTNRLRRSKLFRDTVVEKSRATYENTFGYFEQEGFLDQTKSKAVVWLGFNSFTQKAISRVLGINRHNPTLKNYYFGLYDLSNVAYSGLSYAFYFNQATRAVVKAKMNINLLWSICRAPHTEVMGYAQRLGEFSAILVRAEDESENRYGEVEGLHKELLKITTELVERANFNKFKRRKVISELRRLNNQIMYKPDESQAAAFNGICYYNGSSEVNGTPLVELSSAEEMALYLINKRFNSKKRDVSDEETKRLMFWGYGSLALAQNVKNALGVRWSLLAWDVIRFTIKHK